MNLSKLQLQVNTDTVDIRLNQIGVHHMPGFDDRELCIGVRHHGTKESIGRATELARLITATPDLLHIAKLILLEWEAPVEGVQRGELIARLSQYANEARDAIRKAEGRS